MYQETAYLVYTLIITKRLFSIPKYPKAKVLIKIHKIYINLKYFLEKILALLAIKYNYQYKKLYYLNIGIQFIYILLTKCRSALIILAVISTALIYYYFIKKKNHGKIIILLN